MLRQARSFTVITEIKGTDAFGALVPVVQAGAQLLDGDSRKTLSSPSMSKALSVIGTGV
jgi:hypothetical protein